MQRGTLANRRRNSCAPSTSFRSVSNRRSVAATSLSENAVGNGRPSCRSISAITSRQRLPEYRSRASSSVVGLPRAEICSARTTLARASLSAMTPSKSKIKAATPTDYGSQRRRSLICSFRQLAGLGQRDSPLASSSVELPALPRNWPRWRRAEVYTSRLVRAHSLEIAGRIVAMLSTRNTTK